MKVLIRFLLFILILLILFVVLTYLSVSGTDKSFERATIIEPAPRDEINFKGVDSVTVIASTLYEANAVKRLMQGTNYRQAWEEPVRVPVIFLDSLMGGMEILQEGGGSQTHSLRLKSSKGEVYTLRSITKDPQSHVPEIAKKLGLGNIVIDGVSAQHPYGAILAAELSEAADILHTNPRAVYVPKQDFLGKYNGKYGDRLFLLEYETEGNKDWTPYENVVEIVDTEDLMQLKAETENSVRIDERELVRARLFDLMIGDWDRHAEQWGWILEKKPHGSILAHPLPGDRDNAFFNIGGVIPGILTNKNIQPMVRPFDKDIDYMGGLVYPFDQYFLQKTRKSVFIEEAKALQETYTEEAIHEAFKAWPDQIAALDQTEIAEKILSRKKDLVKYAEEFYKIIQKRGFPERALKGSEELELRGGLRKCFECGSPN